MAEQDFRVQKGIVVADGDVTVPSDHSVFAGTFDTNVTAAGVTLTGTTLAADGTDSNIDINLTPKGTGEVNITKVDINAGTIDGTTIATSDITVGTGKTLNVSAGTLTLANDQISGDKISGGNIGSTTIDTLVGALAFGSDGSGVDVTFHSATAGDNMIWDASEEQLVITGTNGTTALNVADGNVTVADTLTATKIGAFQATGAIDFNSQAMTSVDINSGNIDGTPIGSSNAQSGAFTTMLATTHGRVGGTARMASTHLQVNGAAKGSGTNGSTLTYSEGRLHSDISNDDIAGSWNDYFGMSNAFILDNAENNAGSGQSIVFTEGRSGTSGNGSSFSIGRQLGGHNTASDAKFQIGYKDASYEEVGYANSAGNNHHAQNPACAAMSLLEIDINGNLQLTKGKGNASEGKLIFSGEASDGTDHTISLKAPHNTMTANQNYTLPVAPAASNGYVLSSTTAGVMSWVEQSSGSITALNNHSGNENSLVTIGSTTTQLDAESTATYNGQTLHINTATDNTPAQLLLEHSYNDTEGPSVKLRLDKGAAGAANDILGNIKWQGDDADQNLTNYALIKGDVVAATGGSEEGRLTVQLAQTSNGALADVMVLTGGDETDGTSSKVVIKGDLQVDGDTTTINTTTLEVEDLNVTVAKNAGDSSAADGAGLTVAGASATFTYSDSGTKWTMNKPLDITGALTADTSLTLDSTTITTAEIGVLDGVTPGTVTASKAVVVDSSKDIGTFGTITAGALSVDAVAVINTSSATAQSWSHSTAYVIADFAYGTYRTVKFVGQVSDGTDVDVFEVLVTYKGASAPTNDAAIYMTTYAYMTSKAAPLGSITAVKDASGGTVDLKFTPASGNGGTYKYAVTATQLIKQ